VISTIARRTSAANASEGVTASFLPAMVVW
jgi:hypothetical protein